MAQKRPVAPDTPITNYPTPQVSDIVITLDVDSRLPGYKPLEYGTLYPDQTRFPGAKLVSQAPLEDDRFVRRIYATDRVNQDSYNYAIKYTAGSTDHPVYIRTTIEPRDSYTPLTGDAPDPVFPGAYIVDEEAKPAEGELNSLYLSVTRVFETLPGPIVTSYDTNEAGQKVTQTTQRKLTNGYTLPQATALSSASAEVDGTGVVNETIRTIPSLFSRSQISVERPDVLPQKFRALVPDIETTQLVEGTVTTPTLRSGDISASEAQQTLFVKQTSRRSRTAPTYPVTIVEYAATKQGQLATITSTLDDASQTADTGALIESSEVTNLGDGTTVKVTSAVPSVFPESNYAKAKDDITPQKFRGSVTEIVEEQTVEGQAAMPSTLTGAEISKAERQVTSFVKRISTTSRETLATPKTLIGSQFTGELGGGMATVTETYPYAGGLPTTVAYGTVADEVENLADGKYVRKNIALTPVTTNLSSFGAGVATSLPVLYGQDYDEELDLTIPYSQVVAQPSNTSVVRGERRRSSPKDVAHTQVTKYDVDLIQNTLDTYYWEIPDMVEIRLPDKLISASVVYSQSYGSGSGSGFGDTYRYSKERSDEIRGDVIYNIQPGFNGNIPTVRCVFFLEKNSSSTEQVLNVVRTRRGNSEIKFWPNPRPLSHEITLFNRQYSKKEDYSVSFDSGSEATSESGSISVTRASIPPTIHPRINIYGDNDFNGTIDPGEGSNLRIQVSPSFLPATDYPVFPVGEYIYRINATPYRFSYVRVDVLLVKVTQEYV